MHAQEGRVLSVSVQLSDPSSYKGGGLALGPRLASPDQGCVIIFPSYVVHRVFPVTQGRRHALVMWIRGSFAGAPFASAGLDAHLRTIRDTEGWMTLRKLEDSVRAAGQEQRPAETDVEERWRLIPTGVRWNYGTHLLRVGNHVEAAKVLGSVVEEDSGRNGALNNLALAQYGKGDVQGAILTLMRARYERPGDREVHANLGKFLCAQGDWSAGFASLFKAARMGDMSVILFAAFISGLLIMMISAALAVCVFLLRGLGVL
eukprot:TRINITY_DN59483_c0_g2_i1.p1 TRINITY_DN59483_c0_g2~~TRINITY_DN59483_c0_g2_i1.p1  ORF type:complete len:261 (+),score=39.30 TRINITY_DN59483_c0_g2_i1:308-1090(+)